jgi:hypothetical protein
LIELLSSEKNNNSSNLNQTLNLQSDDLKLYRDELEKIKTISFETYQNFNALSKLSHILKSNLEGNKEHLTVLNNLSQSIDSMATNLNNEGVSKSLNSLENIVNRR